VGRSLLTKSRIFRRTSHEEFLISRENTWFLKMLLLDGVSEVEVLGVQIIKRSVPEDDRK
jgi:hypothetical protein